MRYDIIIIGAGSGGLNIAGFMNRAGFKVLLIDKNAASIGGDCLNYGCVPSKALIHVARLAKSANDACAFGMRTTGSIDLKKAMQYVKSRQDIIREHENADYFRKKGIDVRLGEAVFSGARSVSVNGITHTAKRIVIATGSRPRQLDIPGIAEMKVLTNETIFNLKTLPKRLLVIGGGPIGVELGQAFALMGSKVTILERGVQFLPKEDPKIAAILQKQLEKEGVELVLRSEVSSFEASGGGRKLAHVRTSRGERTIAFDEVLVSIGRELNIQGLGLENAGIEIDSERQKIRVDEYLRTTNKNVFLCGDVAGNYQFTHAAEVHAGVIISNFFSPFKKKLNLDKMAWVTYTSPEIATFGLSAKELTRRGTRFETIVQEFKDDDRAITQDSRDGLLMLHVGDDRILGGSMVAQDAGELSQELMLAVSSGITIDKLFNKTYPYPTATRINKKAISAQYAKKLTPMAKRLLHWLY